MYNVIEFNRSHEIAGLTGDIKQGIWYESGSHSVPDGSGSVVGNHGAYFGLDQILFNENGADPQGLGTFFIYSFSPQDRNVVQNHFATGVIYRGLFGGRETDTTGIGVSLADFSNQLINRHHEITTELFHKFTWTKNAMVQPALQYFGSPGGVNRDALAVGIRVGIDF